jgi:hypothetical protein
MRESLLVELCDLAINTFVFPEFDSIIDSFPESKFFVFQQEESSPFSPIHAVFIQALIVVMQLKAARREWYVCGGSDCGDVGNALAIVVITNEGPLTIEDVAEGSRVEIFEDWIDFSCEKVQNPSPFFGSYLGCMDLERSHNK